MNIAQQKFDALSTTSKVFIASRVFEILEYDDGGPGSTWSSDTLQSLGDMFNAHGVVFTDPNDERL